MFDWSVITQNAHLFAWGLVVTLEYTVITCVLGLIIGLMIALVQLSPIKALRVVGRLFVEFFRNVPLLVWLLWSYYALPIFAGINISKQAAGILALSLYGGAYYAEILRAGIQSLDHGQADAAKALGMRSWQAMRRIILPQAFRQMIPPLAGQTIIQMKNTTLLSVLTVPDLLYQASYVSSFTYRPMEVYTVVGIIFLVILIPSNYLARRLEMNSQ
ncbi:amino acid ABC transporter permease [Ancylobacter rudongensis]|uniref:Glutamate/aspartate import permease protein GltK n=1 Tax=Ancylobacter rudongensis TaxID=177413 RepID=A0A1G4QGN8_9HYPH|nr:amino acid ABC transporter permease [Ancylobacter rudongensis]RTL96624.1 amino acid ABC transporter permease [Ancylobacter aquaticus]SCW43813.1 polar amino acid transport system permease protein [Ancylobacter rudongensis]